MDQGKPAECAAAVREAVASHRAELVTLVRRKARELDADDVVQTAIARALMKSEQVADPTKAAAWVARVVRHEVIDELRRQQRRRKTSAELGEHAAPLDEERVQCACIVVQAQMLEPSHAEILRRVVVDAIPVSRVATELGITPNNAMVRLHRARKALEARLAAHCGTTSIDACSDCGCDARGCCP